MVTEHALKAYTQLEHAHVIKIRRRATGREPPAIPVLLATLDLRAYNLVQLLTINSVLATVSALQPLVHVRVIMGTVQL